MNLKQIYFELIFSVFRFPARVVYFFYNGIVVECIFYHLHKVNFATLLLPITGIMKLRFCWSTGKSVYSLLAAAYGRRLEGFDLTHGQFLYQVNDFFQMKLKILVDEITFSH